MRAIDVLRGALRRMPMDGTVLDVGCGEGGLYQISHPMRPDLRQHGCDIARGDTLDPAIAFARVDLETEALPYPDDQFDFVVLSHVLEHLHSPLEIVRECARVTKPGGALYIEAPSDRALTLSFGGALHWHLILSYWDDPTHVGRPWTPQAFYRMADYLGLEQRAIGYDTSLAAKALLPFDLIAGLLNREPDRIVAAWWGAIGWAAYALLKKPGDLSGKPHFRYWSYRGRPIGPALDAS